MSDAYDLIVVGCGAAGLSAALSFADTAAGRPLRIAVLESAPREERGGATRWTTAGLRAGDDDRLDPDWVGAMQQVSGGLADVEHCRIIEAETPAAIALLRRAGVELTRRRRPLASTIGDHAMGPVGGGLAIVDALAARAEAIEGLEFLYRTEAVELIAQDDGRVSGVRVSGADGAIRPLHAQAVVLACGGFEGNPRMLSEHLGADAGDLKLIAPGLAYNTGAGLRMALAIGADTAGQFDMIHAELVDRRTDRADAVIYVHTYGIVVNGEGRRFWDEGQGPWDATFERIAYEVWRHQNQTAFFIADQTAAAYPAIMAMCDSDLPPIEADTVEDLAAKLGLDAEVLAWTVADYNAAVEYGLFDPYRMDGLGAFAVDPPKSNWAYPLMNPPFFAYPLTAAITFTYGGLRTDIDGRVVAKDGRPIRGLYAAGEIVGLFHNRYPGATSVLKALVFGRRAGAHAAIAGRA